MIFTPGMQRAGERDRGYRIEERKMWGEKVQGRCWQEMTADTEKSRVVAERAMEKANQQLVTPYINLLDIDFRDQGSGTVDQ